MSRLLSLAPLAALFIAQGVGAATGCPELTPGKLYPWQSHGTVPGDKMAHLSIDLDAKGHPTKCRMAKGNFDGDTGYWICQGMMNETHFDPIMKNGVAVAGTVKREFLLMSRNHQRADEAARKRYFADHPDERPGCYP